MKIFHYLYTWMQNRAIDIAPVGPSQPNPLTGYLPNWAIILIGVIFLLAGLISFAFVPYNNKKINRFKDEQLAEYRQKFRSRKNITYGEAKIHLPAIKRVRLFLPYFFGIVFLALGVAFLFNRGGTNRQS